MVDAVRASLAHILPVCPRLWAMVARRANILPTICPQLQTFAVITSDELTLLGGFSGSSAALSEEFESHRGHSPATGVCACRRILGVENHSELACRGHILATLSATDDRSESNEDVPAGD